MTYGPFINKTLMDLFHFFYPVYYGDWKLYKPTIGALRECFETRCVISINSTILLRIPFQATNSKIDYSYYSYYHHHHFYWDCIFSIIHKPISHSI